MPGYKGTLVQGRVMKMNAGEKMQQKKKKRRQQLLRLWLPVAVVAVLVAALSVSGVALSVRQSNYVAQNGPDRSVNVDTKEPVGSESAEPDASEAEEESPESGSAEEPLSEGQSAAEDLSSFAAFEKELEDKASADPDFLMNESLRGLSDRLHGYDYNSLSAEEKQFYDDLNDYLDIELEGAKYASISIPEGTSFSSVEGAGSYYAYLLHRNIGTDKDVDTIREMLANELNNNFAEMSGLYQADPSVYTEAGVNTKEMPNENYRFDRVTANSNPVKKSLATTGAVSGWTEFGLIRSYQNSELPDNLKKYLIANTRMSYAMYALCDLYVHYYGQTREQIIELCSNYTFTTGDTSWGANAYESVLKNPSQYAAACMGFLEYLSVESVLQNNGNDETAVLSFLFDQGPASFRIYNKWLGF